MDTKAFTRYFLLIAVLFLIVKWVVLRDQTASWWQDVLFALVFGVIGAVVSMWINKSKS